MEMSQGSSQYSYVKQTKMSFFSFIKLENRRAEQVLPLGQVGNSGRGEDTEEGEYGANTLYTCL
jgi:hypothetical protein